MAVDGTGQPVAGNLTGVYKYYVTFTNGNEQSRPQLVESTSPLLANNQVTLSNFPTDTSGQWTGMDLYRSVNDDPGDTNFYLVQSFPISGPPGDATTNPPTPVGSYTDNATDAQLQANDQVMSFTGPAATTTTPLEDVVVTTVLRSRTPSPLPEPCNSRGARVATH